MTARSRREIATIGYEGAGIADFIATLKAAGIETVCDVRAISSSRKKGFSKNQLRAALAEAGIGYEHFKALGTPKQGREAAHRGDFAVFRQVFAAQLELAETQAALDELAATAGRRRTCLMCFERDPTTCHRLLVAEELDRRRPVEVVNLEVGRDFRDRS